jgi:squalene-hopene/tetraprenyl-beta-curcumene cyclase
VIAVFGLVGAALRSTPALLEPNPLHDGVAARIDAAVDEAVRFLMSRQDSDGAWRSEVYGAFRDGPSLTPVVTKALLYSGGKEAQGAAARGLDYLAGLVRPGGTIDPGPAGLRYPVYTCALASIALSKDPDGVRHGRARDAYLAHLRGFQMVEALGWRPEDPDYGGFGYGVAPPLRSVVHIPGARSMGANLSATLFAVGALRLAGVPSSDRAIRSALRFVRRCQNLRKDTDAPRPVDAGGEALLDGGFFMSPTVATLNKTGFTGDRDAGGQVRFRSYGGPTADGLRALLACGLGPDSPSVLAAEGWLVARFSAEDVPGQFSAGRVPFRNGFYYYYVWSVAHAFVRAGTEEVRVGAGRAHWAEVLARALLRRRQPDGTWANPLSEGREDDPLLATSYALAALVHCRMVLPGP